MYRLLPKFCTSTYVCFTNTIVSSLAAGRPINAWRDIFLQLLSPMVRCVVFFLLSFALGVPAINSHGVLGMIINFIAIIFIVYIFNFDAAFVVISRYTVFGCEVGIRCICVIYYIRDTILVWVWVFTRVIISWIFLISIGFIVSIDIDYLRRLVF